MSVNYKTQKPNEQFIENVPVDFKVKSYNSKSNYNCKVDILKKQICDFEDDIINNENIIVDKKYHEWIQNNDYVKPYYDIDCAYETEEIMNNNIDILLNKWKEILNNKYPNADLVISSCCRKKTKVSKHNKENNKSYFISFHFIVNNYIIKQCDLNIINKDLESVDGYDNSVYSNGQNFRMVHQSKPDGTSKPFEPLNYKDIDETYNHIIQLHCENFKNDYLIIKPNISPPVTPTTSDDEVSYDKKIDVDFTDLKNTVMGLKPHRYIYDFWWKVGCIIAKETNNSDEGLELFKEWSKLDKDNYEEKTCIIQYNGWKNKHEKQELRYGTLKLWYYEDNPSYSDKNPYKTIYMKNYKPSQTEEGEWEGSPNISGLIDLMNKEFIFVRDIGETIVLDKNDEWYTKKNNQLKELLSKYNFNDFVAKRKIIIGEVWLNHINRREVQKIGFDPTNKPDKNIFNIWEGLRINKEISEQFNIDDCKPILDHIKLVWCKNDQNAYEYVLNWFAHILQKPWIKMGVVLCLKSLKEGAGKGVIMNFLHKIIGKKHYFQCNNLEQIIGSFNGIAEAKVLCNLDEAFWGKDKKKEGMLKNMITEDTKLINKKNKESYVIDDFCNYIITTNNDCFIPAVEGGRRFFALELDNVHSGITTKNNEEYFKTIRECPAGSFAKFLFNRDISTFNPRKFEKTELLQQQIQHGWCSVKKWWFDVITKGYVEHNYIQDKSCDFDEIPETMFDSNGDCKPLGITKTKYKRDKNNNYVRDEKGRKIQLDQRRFWEKDFLYQCYEQKCHGYKLDTTHFWINFRRDCVDNLLEENRFNHFGKSTKFIVIWELEKYRQKFNQLQDWNYIYEQNDYDDWD